MTKIKLTIRTENASDYEAIEKVIIAAFKNLEYSDQTEHMLVARVRNSDSYIPELALVAEYKDSIVGHILLSKIWIRDGQKSNLSLALAPVSVHPDFQKKTIGSQLISAAHKRALAAGFGSVILIGHEEYYPRFGYTPAGKFGISFPFEVPEENGMAMELYPDALKTIRGIVSYPPEFFG